MKIETAKSIYNESPDWYKRVLNDEFGEETFVKRAYSDIKTFDDTCRVCGITEEEFNSTWNNLGLEADTISYEKLKIVAKAINQGWTPDWDNSDQYKYYPYFNLSSGSGFSYSYCSYGRTATGVGSRLVFESREKCEYAAKQFVDLYIQFFTIKN